MFLPHTYTHPNQTQNSPEEVAEQVGKLIVDVGFGYVQSAALGCVSSVYMVDLALWWMLPQRPAVVD